MRTLTALVLTAAIALPAMAQRPQRPGGGFGGPPTGVALLSSEDVQKDLKLSDEQKEKVKTYLAKQAEERRSAFGGGGGARPDPEKLAEARKKIQEDNAKFQKDALTEDQTKRLKQIGYQVGGLSVFSSEEVVKELKISDEQKEKIKSIADQLQKDRREVTGGGGGGGGRPMPPTPDQQKKIEALVKEATEKVQDVLTSDQKKTWETMAGKKFEGKIAPPGGGRRPGAAG